MLQHPLVSSHFSQPMKTFLREKDFCDFFFSFSLETVKPGSPVIPDDLGTLCCILGRVIHVSTGGHLG